MKKKPLKTSILLLSKRLSKTNKQRNGIIVIAMISTMLLLTMLFHITTSIFAIMREQSLREIGTLAEGAYKNITKNQYSKISESDLINDISYNVFIGNCVSTEKFGVKTEIRYSEEKAAAWNFCNLEKGHFPTKENEIVVDDIFLDCLEYKADLSDRIQIQITTESGVLDKEFEICGFYHENRLSAVSELYVSEIFLNLLFDSQKNENRNNNIQAFCRLNTTKSVEKILTDAWNKAGIAENCDIAVNWAYRNISLTPAIFLVIILLLFVIILSGYLIIYNVFYISITNDIQFYGQLKIIGMESKQIKYLLIIQISRLLVVGIPLGFIAGVLIGNFALPKIITVMNYQSSLSFHVKPIVFLLSSVFTLFTVWISVCGPYRLIKSLPPIETIRYSAIKMKIKKRNSKKQKHFLRFIAFRNMQRNRKKARLTVFSVMLLCVIFSILTIGLNSISFERFLKIASPSDIFITTQEFERDEEIVDISEATYKELSMLAEGNFISPLYNQSSIHFLTDKAKLDLLSKTESDHRGILNECRYYYDIHTLLKFDVIEGELNEEKLLSGKYVIMIAELNEVIQESLYHVGEKVTLSDMTKNVGVKVGENGEVSFENLPEKEYTVLAVVKPFYSLSNKSYTGIELKTILPIENYTEIPEEANLFAVTIDSNRNSVEELEKRFSGYMINQNDLSIKTSKMIKEEFSNLRNVFILLGAVLTFFTAVISLVNFINHCVTGIIARKQEFLTLRAIGMTRKQLLLTLRMENLFQITISVLLGLMISYGFCALAGQIIEKLFRWVQIQYTFIPQVIMIFFMAVFACLTPNFFLNRVIPVPKREL